MGSNRFWHIVSVVKERLYASLSCRVANNNLIRVTDPPYLSTRVHLLKSLFHTSPQPFPHLPRTPPLTTLTIDTFPHFPKFFFREFPAQNPLHSTFSKIPFRKISSQSKRGSLESALAPDQSRMGRGTSMYPLSCSSC